MAANIPPPSAMSFTGDWSTNWDVFRSEYEDYVLVTGVAEKDNKIQAATLRSVMGGECRHVYRHNLNLTAEQREDPAAILSALERYFKPAKNMIYERYLFGCCKQEDSESIDAFVTRLREKASTCEYGQLKDEMIRDKIVLGIASESSRRRLLREKDLNLVTAIEMCRAAEQTDLRMRVMETAGTHVMHTEAVHSAVKQPAKHFKARQSDSNKTVDTNCRYCGNTHARGRDHCPAFGKKCKLCGSNNHFAKVCMKSKRGSTTGKVLCMDGEAESGQSSEEETHLYMIESVSAVGQTKGNKWFVTLKLNSKSQRCQLDSGATCNIMTLKDKKKLSSKAKLRQSNASLRLYSGEIIKSLGVFDTECTIQGIRHKLSFEIVKKGQLPLLSGDTCERLGFMRFTIPEDALKVDTVVRTGHLTKDTVVNKYNEVFTSPVEALPGEVHFDLDPDVKPVQCAPRNVPIALKTAVKAQLDKYEAEGHVAPVTEPTDWISNMVIVSRPQKLRICLDPKFLNKALRRSHYIMPTLEDVLYKLPKARVFTLVDARDAFLQCKLDTESSFMTTFWTPWGRKRWLKLPFGVSVAPEVYQRKQHELLAGLEGIEPIADDILVVGCGDSDEEAETDHDTKLLALLNRCREVKLRLGLKKLNSRCPKSVFMVTFSQLRALNLIRKR